MYTGLTFSWEANYADPVVERLTWGTDTITHRDASEQRRQFRLDPRRQLEYSILPLTVQERSSLDIFLWGAMRSPVMLPIWTDAQTLQADAASGQPVVSVTTTTYDFDVGEYCCLWRDWNLYEVVQIQSMTSSSITLTQNLVSTWPATLTAVLPARLARIAQKQTSARFGGDVATWRLTFEISEASRSSNRINVFTPQQVLGVDVYPSDSDYSESLPLDLDGAFGLIDFGTGAVAVDSAAKLIPATIFQYSDLFATREAISIFWGYSTRWNGSRIPFWLSTQEADFDLTQLSTGLSGTMTWKKNGLAAFQLPNNRKQVSFHYCSQGQINPPGTEIYKTISAITDIGGGLEQATLNVEEFGGGDFDKVRASFLRYCRLESDTIELTWLGGCGAQVKLVIRELPNYPS